jgi:hypothetical protein
MTRFTELKRIESAINNLDNAELEWAVSYCNMRLRIAHLKHHQKHWRRILQKVQKAQENSK